MDINRIGVPFSKIVESQRDPLSTRIDVLANRTMSNEWSEIPFAQLLSEPIRNGIYKKKEFHGSGAKVVNMGELFANPRLRDVHMRRVELSESEQSRFRVQAGDLLFARRSLVAEGAGKCSIVLEINELTAFESSIIRARPDQTKADSLFLYYYFNSPIGFHLLDTIRRQVAVAGITGTDLAQLPIKVPPLSEQRLIAHILGTLDDKIELNHRMNATLKNLAQALFKSWFVDFEPVRAKMEGRWRRGESLPGMPAELYDLFPDRLVPLELREMPEGWRVKAIGELANIVGGTTPSTKRLEYWEGGVHQWATPRDLSYLTTPVLLETARKITDAGLGRIGSGLLPIGSVLLSSRAPIGYLAITEIPVAINQGFIGILPNEGISNLFMLYWCESSHDEIINHANGSTFLEISKSNFRQLLAIVPDKAILIEFNRYAQEYYQRVVSNEIETRTLAALREALLPKLVSGELQVGS